MGCRQVYLLLNENGLCNYYDFEKNPAIKAKGKFMGDRFAYLDDETIYQNLVQFSSDKQTNITFSLPQMHCSSCVYLLENLHRIEPGIITSRSNFQRKEIFVSFNPGLISLRKVVELLAFIGYEPNISLQDVKENAKYNINKKNKSPNRKQIFSIGIAGFCFANIMMLSFPEYFSSGHIGQQGLKETFSWLNLVLSIPVLLFSASGIFISAWKGLKQRFINIDAPIALAITVTFARSYYEIISGTGAGYLDSGTGIVFFMLIGRWFQGKTYDSLSFDRDYRSYFPLGVTVSRSGIETNIPVTKLKKGDHIIIRNEEMIPSDAILLRGDARIDYSFVSGENTPVKKMPGELLYAGGKQCGTLIELEVKNEVAQSYITELWNNDVFNTSKNRKQSFIHPWSRYFTFGLLTVAAAAVVFWWIYNPANILPALTAVLIVACPCSLLLSATFTYGNMLRIFGKNKLYLKNSGVIESMAAIDTIVFDKTGTITYPNQAELKYEGNELSGSEKNILKNLSRQSSHPLSRIIANQLEGNADTVAAIHDFKEYPGKGIAAMANNRYVKMGSAAFIGETNPYSGITGTGTQVHIRIGNELKGKFSISNRYRKGIKKMILSLKYLGYRLHILSGDNDSEKENLQYMAYDGSPIRFRQTPADKLNYVKHLQSLHKKVMMIGDGLNDSGALMQADVGIAINDNSAQFTPACDAILDGSQVHNIDKLLQYAKAGQRIVMASFILSIMYNIIGLSFAVSAGLSPLIAAILMPASSISIVLFVTLASSLQARKYGL